MAEQYGFQDSFLTITNTNRPHDQVGWPDPDANFFDFEHLLAANEWEENIPQDFFDHSVLASNQPSDGIESKQVTEPAHDSSSNTLIADTRTASTRTVSEERWPSSISPSSLLRTEDTVDVLAALNTHNVPWPNPATLDTNEPFLSTAQDNVLPLTYLDHVLQSDIIEPDYTWNGSTSFTSQDLQGLLVPSLNPLLDTSSNIFGPSVDTAQTRPSHSYEAYVTASQVLDVPGQVLNPALHQEPRLDLHRELQGSQRLMRTTSTRAALDASQLETRKNSSKKQNGASFTFSSGVNKFHTGRSRKAFTKERRQEVAATRARGACFRCKVSKYPCLQLAGQSICQKCMTAGGCLEGLCFRLDLSDCLFYRSSSFLQPKGPRTDLIWATPTTIYLTLDMPNIPNAPPLRVACRQFKPLDSDMTADYTRGEEVGAVIEVPTYAAIDLSSIEHQVCMNGKAFGRAFLEMAEAEATSNIVTGILRAAFNFAESHPNSILNLALDLWAGSRMCAFDRSLVGDELLGQTKVADPLSPMFGVCPIPPMLDIQCDSATFRWMRKIADKLLKALWKKMENKRSRKKPTADDEEEWLEVFLSIFVMINNVEFVYGIAKELAAQYIKNAEERASEIGRLCADMLEHWTFSVKHLLYLYRTFFKRGFPFRSESSDGVTHKDQCRDTIQALVACLEQHRVMLRNGTPMNKADDDFDYSMHWTSDMFHESEK